MNNIKIITDSCADLSTDLLEKYDIDYAKMNTVYKGKESPALLSWGDRTPKEFYDILRSGERISTTQVPVPEFKRIFKEYLDKGYDIIYIGCSSKQSGSINTGHVVSKELKKDHPGAMISCIDSMNASIGLGMLAVYAAGLAAEGKNFTEIEQAVRTARKRVNQFVTVHSLDSLKRAGRVTASSAFFGNLMGVKPILISDADGVQTPIKKVRGRLRSLEEIADLLEGNIEDASAQTVYIAHADCDPEEVSNLKNMVNDIIKPKDIVTVYIGPIIGASVGPDAIGVWGFVKEVTYRAEENK